MKVTATLLALVAVTLAGPIKPRSPYVVKESHYVPNEWVQKDRAPADKLVNLNIGLKQGDFDELEKSLYEGMSPAKFCSMNSDDISVRS